MKALATAALDLPQAEQLVARVDWKKIRRVIDRFRVTDGKGFRLKHHDSADTAGTLLNKQEAAFLQQWGVEQLAKLQEKLYADSRWALLCVFQATDAAGKDGTIKHVMSGVNPQGVQVSSFKSPGPEQLAHDYLWRIHAALPERGKIGIFNRSHYEEVLAVRVHPDFLDRQRLPDAVRGKKFWAHRMEDIANFERYLSRQGIVVLKFYLNVSKEEQKRRLLARLEEPDKNWKFSASDLAERGHWGRLRRSRRGGDRRHRRPARSLVRRAGRQQVVHPAVHRGGHRRDAAGPRPQISRGHGGAEGASGQSARTARTGKLTSSGRFSPAPRAVCAPHRSPAA